NLTEHLDVLQAGENILAIHGLNESTGSSDFLIQAKLIAGIDSGLPSPPTTISPLNNDHDANGQPLALSSFDADSEAGGTVTQDGNQLVYTPPLALAGLDWFHYTISDAAGKTGRGVVLIDSTPFLNNLDLTPSSRSISASGGSFHLDVEARTSWNWRRGVETDTWLTTGEPFTQRGNQMFSYNAAINPSPLPRTAQLIFTEDDTIRIYEITQAGNPDIHGNTPETAAVLEVDSPLSASLDIPGDVDFFKIEIATESILTLGTTGQTDTLGTLMDSSRRILVQNNNGINGGDMNFQIIYRARPGTYYLRVRHPLASGTGQYVLTGSLAFIPYLTIRSTDSEQGETIVDLAFTSQAGESYRIKSSADLVNWDTVEEGIFAESATVERSYPFNTTASPRLFLRVEEE
ncbi:MAG: Ig-like domain-containing protein, partial [Roseibacillus sp.]|nr:Ig-like domain-containing protein [Roseibacillus sp.]